MNSVYYSMSALFEQLGLDNDPESIDRFIAQHHAALGSQNIEHAPFWTDTQQHFLAAAAGVESVWAGAINQLDARLRY